MAYAPLTKIPQQFFDNLGNPLVSGTLYAYLAGTSTPTNMFSDNAGTVAGTSVVLDSRGEPTTFKLIWLNTAVIYKFVLKDSTGTTIWTIDNISGDDGTGNTASSVFDQQTITATAGQTLFNLGYSYVTGTNAMAVYKNGSRLITGTDFTETSSTSVTLTMAAIAGDEYTFIGGQDVSSSFSGTNVSFIQSGTGAVTRSVQTKLRETVSVLDFGAVGDGVTDDTTAIQAGIDAALTAGKQIIAQGTFKISSKVVIKGDTDFSQATFNVYSTPAVAVEVSTGNATNPTTEISNAVIWLPKRINNMTKPATGWASQGVGVRVVNAYSCQIFVGNTVNFATGLLMTSFGTGSTYNNIYIGHLENNQVNLALTPGNTGAWVNENNFIGGRFSHYSAEGTAVAGTRHILMSKASNVVNNNLFVKPSIEGNVVEYNVENGGSYNTIQQGRWESTTPKVLYTADNANQANNNYIVGGYGSDSIVFTYAGGVGGSKNRLYGYNVDYITLSEGRKIQNQGSSASAIDLFYEAGTRPETAASTEWSVSHSSIDLKGKRKADTYYRLKLDYQSSRIYFDNGTTAAPTAYISNYGANDIALAGCSWKVQTDNTYSLGTAGLRWSVVYAGTGTINTSDEREKQDIAPLDEAEKRVAAALKGLIKKFRFKDAVEKKGDDARIHVGVIAQEVMAAFQAENLDPMQYAIVCYDEWGSEVDEDGNEIRTAGNRYGVRYDQLLAFIISAI